MPDNGVRDLVLVGGGHAHIFVLERCIERGAPDARLTLVVDRRIADAQLRSHLVDRLLEHRLPVLIDEPFRAQPTAQTLADQTTGF